MAPSKEKRPRGPLKEVIARFIIWIINGLSGFAPLLCQFSLSLSPSAFAAVNGLPIFLIPYLNNFGKNIHLSKIILFLRYKRKSFLLFLS